MQKLTPAEQKIYDYAKKNKRSMAPCSREASRYLGCSPEMVSNYYLRLQAKGLLRKEIDGKKSRYIVL